MTRHCITHFLDNGQCTMSIDQCGLRVIFDSLEAAEVGLQCSPSTLEELYSTFGVLGLKDLPFDNAGPEVRYEYRQCDPNGNVSWPGEIRSCKINNQLNEANA